jgi:hypothetical protein
MTKTKRNGYQKQRPTRSTAAKRGIASDLLSLASGVRRFTRCFPESLCWGNERGSADQQAKKRKAAVGVPFAMESHLAKAESDGYSKAEYQSDQAEQYTSFRTALASVLTVKMKLHQDINAGNRTNEARATEWRQRLDSSEFWHQVRHFRQLADKFDRAAGYVSECTEAAEIALVEFHENVQRHIRGESTGVPNPFHESGQDLPIFLDSMLFYLRIQADSYAQLVRYFYEAAKSKIVSGDFHKQTKDFAKLDFE